MSLELRYIELKSGYADDGPAWIGRVKISRTGNTIYFNDHAYQKCRGISGNYVDIETGEEYWISGVKKDGTDRHQGGSGKIVMDTKVVDQYLELVGKTELNESKFILEEIQDCFPVERIHQQRNVSNSDLSGS